MKITHVLRGEEWISSAPKHKLLYQYFGWDMPELCHLPLLRNPDKSKLSKRKNPTSILYYKRMGFMPEALLNYLGRMGWSMPDESEKFTLQQMLDHFDILRVSLGGPIFDIEKLKWLNGCWLREDLSEEQLMQRLQEWAFNPANFSQVLHHFRQRIEVFSDLAPAAAFLFAGQLPITPAHFAPVNMDEETRLKVLQFAQWQLENLHRWDKDSLFGSLKILAGTMGIKIKDFLAPIFVAVAGTTASISVIESMVMLGPDVSRARLRHAIEVLGGISKKQAKAFEKEYHDLTRQKE